MPLSSQCRCTRQDGQHTLPHAQAKVHLAAHQRLLLSGSLLPAGSLVNHMATFSSTECSLSNNRHICPGGLAKTIKTLAWRDSRLGISLQHLGHGTELHCMADLCSTVPFLQSFLSPDFKGVAQTEAWSSWLESTLLVPRQTRPGKLQEPSPAHAELRPPWHAREACMASNHVLPVAAFHMAHSVQY